MSVPRKRHWRMEVEWEDSTLIHEGWKPIDDLLNSRQAVRCLSVGFVLADDKSGVVLAASIHGNEAAGVTMIPRAAVKKRKRLR